MKIKQILTALMLLSVISCAQDKSKALLKEIEKLESQILESGDVSKKQEVAINFVEKVTQYAEKYPDDKATPDVLFKGGDVARGLGDYGKAIKLWGKLWRTYGNHPKAPMALFLQGFTFDSDIRDPKMAAKYYNDFLVTYPNDSLATQAKQLLQVVEMSPEDLVKQFKEGQ